MDDGELDFSDQDMFSIAGVDSSSNMDSFLDEILKSTHTCTHTHTCNPPGPDKTHTHTCFHTHTQLFASPSEDEAAPPSPVAAAEGINGGGSGATKKKRPLGNREAVRKYREKKKAHAAYLEEQVSQLKALNQQLVRRLQGQAALEAEVVRLRALLVDFRGKIDGELGNFPYNSNKKQQQQIPSVDCSRPLSGGFYLNAVTVPCDADVPCFHHEENNPAARHQQQQVHLACDFVSEEGCQGMSAP